MKEIELIPKVNSLEELTQRFSSLCQLYAEGQTDMGPLITLTWDRILEEIETSDITINQQIDQSRV
jgi:hypothetical protein